MYAGQMFYPNNLQQGINNNQVNQMSVAPQVSNPAGMLNFNSTNPQMFNAFGGLQNFQNNFNNFANNFMNTANMSPQQMVQQKLDSGQMTPQQFAEIRRIANSLTGMNY